MKKPHIDALDLNLLAVFDALLREGSVTKAALALGSTQSAVSHALNRLRAFFDDPLFVKSPSGMTPTVKAESLRDAVVDVMTSVREQILSVARFDPATARRTFTLCMADVGELIFLPLLIERLRREAPYCSIRTRQAPTEQLVALLAAGDADLAIGSIYTPPEELFQQLLFRDSSTALVSARNREVGTRLTRTEFEEMPHVVVSLDGRGGSPYDGSLAQQGITLNVFLVTPHFLTVPLLLEQHPDLLSIVPVGLAAVFERYGAVRAVQLPIVLPPCAVSQYWHPRFHRDPAVVWLRNLIKKTFEKRGGVSAPEALGDDRSLDMAMDT